MPNPLTMKLEQVAPFTDDEERRRLDVRGPRTVANFNPDYLRLDRTEVGHLEVAGRAGDLV